MGMKVAAVATMCQDRRVWEAMMAAGTLCPYEGQIGEKARALWEANPHRIPKYDYKTAAEAPKKPDVVSQSIVDGSGQQIRN